MIIGLIGNKRTGKDTVADYLVKNYNFKKYAFADQIKKVANTIFGWSDIQLNGDNKDQLDNELDIVPRQFFEWFGTDIMQHQFDEKFTNNKIPPRAIWAYSVLKKIQRDLELYTTSDLNIVITDFRFMHEFNLLTSKLPEIKFIFIDKFSNYNTQDTINIDKLLINSKDWQYEIYNMLINIYENNTDMVIIKNNSTYDYLYSQIDSYMNELGITNCNFKFNYKDAYYQ
jgi:dephospho-CoA kinase